MDLNSPTSILILGFLVLVFGSILRRRATDQLQYWFLGWILLLVHLVFQLVGKRVGVFANLTSSLSNSAMILAALSFMLAVCFVGENSSRRKLLIAAAATASLVYSNAVAWNLTSIQLLYSIVLAGTSALIVLFRLVFARAARLFWFAVSALVAVAAVLVYCVSHGE